MIIIHIYTHTRCSERTFSHSPTDAYGVLELSHWSFQLLILLLADQPYRKKRDPSAIVAKLTVQAKAVHVALTRGAVQLGRGSVSELNSLIVVRPDSYHIKFLVRRLAVK